MTGSSGARLLFSSLSCKKILRTFNIALTVKDTNTGMREMTTETLKIETLLI